VEEVFGEALMRESADRGAYLDAACEGDASLRAEVEALLGARDRARAAGFDLRMPEDVHAALCQGASAGALVGSDLGHFHIEGYLGAGGMGEVYRARDRRLGREVAIKLAREPFGGRFEREARAIAALNHPSICTLHDIGPNYLVMELIEGPTLADRIAKGRLPLAEALRIASDIAGAMEIAHEKGIVHRDLKPANIKLTPERAVKVLDFGIAKAGAMAEEAAAVPGSGGGTHGSQVFGTAAYMAPEQARGDAVDRRADIWAFGTVVYEMLTGRAAFRGKTSEQIVAAAAGTEPDFTVIPPAVRPVLQRCLRKEPRERWQSIADVRIALELATQGPSVPQTRRQIWPWIAAAVALMAAPVAIWIAARGRGLVERTPIRLSVDLGPEATPAGRTIVAISPDGNRLVFLTNHPDGKSGLTVRLLNEARDIPLRDTEDAVDPFFSPDGEWIGFFAEGKMKKTLTRGGAVTVLCDASAPRGASWGEDGEIVFTPRGRGGLLRVPAAGGTPRAVTDPAASKEVTHRWPQVLRGGKEILFTAHTLSAQYDQANIDVLSVETGKRKTLVHGGYFGRLAGGYLLYVRQGVLFGARFDARRLELAGPAVPVVNEIAPDASTGAGHFDFSQTGTLVYRAAAVAPNRPLIWIDRSGATAPLLPAGARYQSLALSPDGERVAVAVAAGSGSDLYVYERSSGATKRLTSNGQGNAQPVWAPDGRHIAFSCATANGRALAWIRSDGGEPQQLLENRNAIVPSSFSPDGRMLAYDEQDVRGALQIWLLPLDTADPDHPRPLQPRAMPSIFNELEPAISPDGKWIAYTSSESVMPAIFVRPFPGGPGKWQVSKDSGRYALWSRTGPELIYLAADGRIVSVKFSIRGGAFHADSPHPWENGQVAAAGGRSFDMAPDGRLAMVAKMGAEPSLHVTFVLNFFEELRNRVSGEASAPIDPHHSW
jgi:serine/threonine-protein kinase